MGPLRLLGGWDGMCVSLYEEGMDGRWEMGGGLLQKGGSCCLSERMVMGKWKNGFRM